MRWRLGICLIGLLALAGCAIQPPVTEQGRLAAFAIRQARISKLSNWTLEGRAAIRTARDSGSVTVHWRQQGAHYSIGLIAPLGAGSVRLIGDTQRVWLQTSRGESAVAGSARDLLNRYTGYDLPVASLHYWLRGILAPGPVQVQELDPKGRLAFLMQQGWRIRFREYERFSGVELPTALDLQRDQVEVRLVIWHWGFSA
ncbi:MAG TPA: lipoprotein insertase outer membrane protein LolB [Nitrococcus sp.]|nr:lipoprotein insertase outer membrane protein LolB [Nitrococcus sp.]